MKKIIVSLTTVALLLTSCGNDKKEAKPAKQKENAVEQAAPVANEAAKSDGGDTEQIALGEKLFSEKTCVSCHQLDAKVIGPSIKEIVKIYDEKGANIFDFLKGDSKAIVDTDPGQVAIMQANLDGFVKDLSDDELHALVAYFENAK